MCKRRKLWVHSPRRLNWQQVTDDLRAPESHWSSSGLNCRYRFKFLALAINMYCFVNIVTELVIRASEWTFECRNWKRNFLKSIFLGSKRCQHASHIWLQHSPRSASSSGASFFRKVEASDWWWTARDHGKGTDGRRCAVSPIVSFPPSFARTFLSRERDVWVRDRSQVIFISDQMTDT